MSKLLRRHDQMRRNETTLCAEGSDCPFLSHARRSRLHVVVMEYENWFGPEAVTFQTAAATPLLQSTDMQPVGSGYDRAELASNRPPDRWLF